MVPQLAHITELASDGIHAFAKVRATLSGVSMVTAKQTAAGTIVLRLLCFLFSLPLVLICLGIWRRVLLRRSRVNLGGVLASTFAGVTVLRRVRSERAVIFAFTLALCSWLRLGRLNFSLRRVVLPFFRVRALLGFVLNSVSVRRKALIYKVRHTPDELFVSR